MNKADSFLEGFVVFDERVERYAIGGFFFGGLDEERKFEAARSLDRRARRKDREVGHADFMIGEKLLRHAFVLAKRQTRRARSGVRHAHHFEQAGDVPVVGGHLVEMFGQVENDVGRIGFDLVDDHAGLIPNADSAHFMAELFERFDDMSLRRPIVGF